MNTIHSNSNIPRRNSHIGRRTTANPTNYGPKNTEMLNMEVNGQIPGISTPQKYLHEFTLDTQHWHCHMYEQTILTAWDQLVRALQADCKPTYLSPPPQSRNYDCYASGRCRRNQQKAKAAHNCSASTPYH
jgi:hypothetical protein